MKSIYGFHTNPFLLGHQLMTCDQKGKVLGHQLMTCDQIGKYLVTN